MPEINRVEAGRDMPDLFLTLAEHILAMETDAYLQQHPEWIELCREAHEAIEAIEDVNA